MLITSATDLPRLMTCNGSRLMGGAIPPTTADNDTTQRDEGTAAHYMASAVFNGHFALDELTDKKAPNGVYLAEEIVSNVAKYLEIATAYPFARMEYDTSHDNSPHWVVNGRSDLVGLKDRTLDITDFKYGWRIVEPEMNWTLISHAISFCNRLEHPTPDLINFNIFQPRPYHPEGPLRTWTRTFPQLMELRDKLNSTLCNPSNQLVTSNHCGDCRALVPCPAARLAEMNAIDVTTNVFQDDIPNDHLSQALDNLNRAEKMIEDRKKAYEELAKHRIKAGQVVNNYSVDLAYGHRAWNEGIDAGTLQIMTGKVLSVEKLVTPAEAERRGVDEATVKALTNRPMIGVKLVRVKASKKGAKLFQGNTTKGK